MQNLYANSYVCNCIIPTTGHSWDRKMQADDKATGALTFCPTSRDADMRWSEDRMLAALAYLDWRRDGLKREVAGKLASILWTGIQAHPNADQLTIVKLENGSYSIHSTADLDLSTGYMSGGNVATAMMIEVRGLRERMTRAIDAAAILVGEK